MNFQEIPGKIGRVGMFAIMAPISSNSLFRGDVIQFCNLLTTPYYSPY
jgi:hypothetical protein